MFSRGSVVVSWFFVLRYSLTCDTVVIVRVGMGARIVLKGLRRMVACYEQQHLLYFVRTWHRSIFPRVRKMSLIRRIAAEEIICWPIRSVCTAKQLKLLQRIFLQERVAGIGPAFRRHMHAVHEESMRPDDSGCMRRHLRG